MQHILCLPLGDTNQPPKGQAAFDELIRDQRFLLQKSKEFFCPKPLGVASAQGHCCFIGTIYFFGRSSLQEDESTPCHWDLGGFLSASANYCSSVMPNLRIVSHRAALSPCSADCGSAEVVPWQHLTVSSSARGDLCMGSSTSSCRKGRKQ